MATPNPSGTYSFLPTLAEVSLEVFDRLGMRPTELTQDHWVSIRRSMNLVFSSWSNRGVNLFLVDTQTVNLAQGVATYSVPTSTVNIEEAYLRMWNMGQATDVTPDFATTSGDATITATQANHGYAANGFINIEVPVAVGGLVLSGYYQITSVPDANTYTFEASSNASSTASGGAVPLFTTVAASTSVTVTLAAHGYLAGETFLVGVSTSVGGITVFGTYTIATVVDANNFTITALQTPGASASAYENDGDTQIAGQATSTQNGQPPYTDILLAPFSRVDYSNVPNKLSQGRPSQYYYNRLTNPTFTLWLVPDNNGPYQMIYNRTTQPQDCNPQGTETPFVPYRFLESLHADVAAHMSIKWRPDIAEKLYAYAADRWKEAAETDSERVTMHIVPSLSSYYGGGGFW